MSLLTDEDILEAWSWAGNTEPPDMDGVNEIVKLSQAATLKAVAEWLVTNTKVPQYSIALLLGKLILMLREGTMPGEE